MSLDGVTIITFARHTLSTISHVTQWYIPPTCRCADEFVEICVTDTL